MIMRATEWAGEALNDRALTAGREARVRRIERRACMAESVNGELFKSWLDDVTRAQIVRIWTNRD